MTEVITGLEVRDVRFPTSRTLTGSDAMNPDPDYSAAYVVIHTSGGQEGHSLVFTLGEGTEIQVAAVRALEPLVRGLPIEDVLADLGAFGRRLTGHSPLRWLGPEKGVVHMAIGGVINAVWDLYGMRVGKPVWKLLADLAPAELVALIDFRYIADALTADDALVILSRAAAGREQREEQLRREGYPAYTTTPGWLGYDDGSLAELARAAVADGFGQIKLKVGGDLADDRRRLAIARAAVGPEVRIAIDANQVWGVGEAIAWVQGLAEFDPFWIEEPTAPDDVLGHAKIRQAVAPVKVATGEHTHNQQMFKQLLQAGGVDVINLDACRVAGINENVAILVLAAKYGVPVCPHAGGLGLCEMVQHLAMFDFVAVSGTLDGRAIEYVDHLHEHFVEPVRVIGGRYLAPDTPGLGAQLTDASLAEYEYAGDGVASPWASRGPQGRG
ncbi:MAG: enolase C-terminal domain-like protein [Solirubrobacteraceae bacterium]